MLVGLSGSAFTLERDEERDFDQAEALRLIKAGFAVPVADSKIERAVVDPIVETRIAGPVETADIGRQHRNKKRRR